jgi:hypothetical protein
MGSFPALMIKPPNVASPQEGLASTAQALGTVQQLESGSIALQNARTAQQEQRTIMDAYQRNNGDWDQTLADIKGSVRPETWMPIQAQVVAQKTALAALQDKQLDVQHKQLGMISNSLDAIRAVPEPQRSQALATQFAQLHSSGVDVSKLAPALAQLPDMSDGTLNNLKLGLVGMDKFYTDEKAYRSEASQPTVAQAQAKTAAELDSAQTAALMAHQQLLNLPTPEEAKTKRMADLRETMAQTAAANATTAEKIASTALIGAQPVFAFDPQTQTRVLTTMPQAGAKGFTNPVKASEGDINKETELTKQFNDVQMNVSRYRNAINVLSNSAGEHTTEVAHILSEGKFDAGHLASLLPGASLSAEIVNQKQIAADWNKLTSEEQDAVTGYLRAKGSVIAFQKALTQTGRTSKEALAIEMQNLPSPLEASGPALKQMDAFQENIDTASKGIVRVPWLPSTQDVRQNIEGQAAKQQAQEQAASRSQAAAQAANPQTGQYRNATGRAMAPGQDAYDNATKRYIGKVSRIYPDGSYDVSQ